MLQQIHKRYREENQSIAPQKITNSQREAARKKGTAKQPDDKMTLVSSYQLVITLNGNGFNLQIKKQSGWMDKEQD